MKITDDMLFECAAEARDIWLRTLPVDEDIPELPTSKAFEKKMQKLIKEQRRNPRVNIILKVTKRTIAAMLAVVVLSFGSLMTVEAYREKVIEIVVQVFHELTDYRFASEKHASDDIVLPDVSFDYIPNGMQEVENKVSANNGRCIIYEDSTGKFFELTQRAVGSNGDYGSILDTENSNCTPETINGNEAFSNVKDGNASIFWTQDNVIYDIYGNLDLFEIVAIAKNMKIINN